MTRNTPSLGNSAEKPVASRAVKIKPLSTLKSSSHRKTGVTGFNNKSYGDSGSSNTAGSAALARFARNREDYGTRIEAMIRRFDTYEEFLLDQVNDEDRFFVNDEYVAMQLVELGYRNNIERVTREKFYYHKELYALDDAAPTKQTEIISNLLPWDRNNVLLTELARRESPNRTGELYTIIFMRVQPHGTQREYSSYIDYAHRLSFDNFEKIFSGRQLLQPTTYDLCYCSWEDFKTSTLSTPNWAVTYAPHKSRMLFVCRHDKKIIVADPNAPSTTSAPPGTVASGEKIVPYVPFVNDTRHDMAETDLPSGYLQVTFIDHYLDRTAANKSDDDEDGANKQQQVVAARLASADVTSESDAASTDGLVLGPRRSSDKQNRNGKGRPKARKPGDQSDDSGLGHAESLTELEKYYVNFT